MDTNDTGTTTPADLTGQRPSGPVEVEIALPDSIPDPAHRVIELLEAILSQLYDLERAIERLDR